MRESEIQAAFVAHLTDRGWDVTTDNLDHTDVIAKWGAERIVAEVKGHTTSPGLDVDTMYGQLLRRKHADLEEDRYAVVVPEDTRSRSRAGPAGDPCAVTLRVTIPFGTGRLCATGREDHAIRGWRAVDRGCGLQLRAGLSRNGA